MLSCSCWRPLHAFTVYTSEIDRAAKRLTEGRPKETVPPFETARTDKNSSGLLSNFGWTRCNLGWTFFSLCVIIIFWWGRGFANITGMIESHGKCCWPRHSLLSRCSVSRSTLNVAPARWMSRYDRRWETTSLRPIITKRKSPKKKKKSGGVLLATKEFLNKNQKKRKERQEEFQFIFDRHWLKRPTASKVKSDPTKQHFTRFRLPLSILFRRTA